jgi:hypothetical protein
MPNLTLLDWAKRVDPDGSVPVIANLLSQTNEILQDATYVQANGPTSHRVTVATGLPTIYYRALNVGIPTSKATTAQVDEGISILEAISEVDIDLANLNGNTGEFRLSEARLFIEAMNQAKATGDIYGNPSTNSNQYLGLAPRYSSLAAGNSQNILDGGGASGATNTSVWLICWSDQTVFCTFPKGSKAGLVQEDLGPQTAYQSATTDTFASGTSPTLRLRVLQERFQWKTGLVVKDWRYAVRIANLEVTSSGTNSLLALTGTMAPTATSNLLHLMGKAVARIPNPRMGRCAFYMNATAFSALMRLGLEKSNAALSVNNAFGQFGTPSAMLSFMGYPIRQCDAILNTETKVT